MAGLSKGEPHGEAAGVFSYLDRMSDERARMMPFRAMAFPRWREAGELIQVEEFREDGTLAVRADLPGTDPGAGAGLTVSGGMLRIGAGITAACKAGVLEIRIPEPEREPARKIAVSKA